MDVILKPCTLCKDCCMAFACDYIVLHKMV